MAQYRQSGTERSGIRNHHLDLQNPNGNPSPSVSIRMPSHKSAAKIRRLGRSEKGGKKVSLIAAFALILALVLSVTFFAYNYLSGDKEYHRFHEQNNNLKDEVDAFSNRSNSKPFKVLRFGDGSAALGRDSRYWDKDDRRRDREYDEDSTEHTTSGADDGSSNKDGLANEKNSRLGEWGRHHQGKGMYNEAGRDELKHYEAEYVASLRNGENAHGEDSLQGQKLRRENEDTNVLADELDTGFQNEELDLNDEYDDGIDFQDAHTEDLESRNGRIDYPDALGDQDDDISGGVMHSDSIKEAEDDSSVSSQSFGNVKSKSIHASNARGESTKKTGSHKKPDLKKKGKRHKFSGSSCDMKFLNSTAKLVEPVESKKFSRFSLQYVEVEDRLSGIQEWEPRFAGHQSLEEREESFYARDQKINCGFIKGPNGSPSTGFDLAEDDVKFMSSCHIAVSSCIFGNSDNLRTPLSKTVTRLSRKNICFVMFVDEDTLRTLSSEGQTPDWMGYIGLWRIVVVKNLPYNDMRRVGKVPKFLAHRLFPSARYSIWLDSKLRLQSDPHLILEYFLWRKGYEYAISNHYDRHCVWEEVTQNKRLNKFNHTIIDQQFAFYQADGLKRFNASDPKKPLPSYVPEGSFIVRAHTPMSNLFSCLWFNEVERFTPRDQLSFAYTYLKLRRMNSEKTFYLNMFKDCERRSIAKLFHHRAEDKRSIPLQAEG